jgi:hypothetical protein
MKNLENGEGIMFGRTFSEIPPNPPLKKGGRGDFGPGPWSKGKSWFLVASLPIYEALLKSDRSRTFRTKSRKKGTKQTALEGFFLSVSSVAKIKNAQANRHP